MTDSLISVIIPTRNEAKTLALAIESLLTQTYRNLEILVVDDRSTDNTREIVAELSAKDARVRYLLCPADDPYRTDWRGVNVGVGWLARNFGMKESKGEWITFQDADDASLLNRIETQYELAKKYDATLACVSWQKLDARWLNKAIDVPAIMHARDENHIVIRPNITTAFVREAKGIFMHARFPHSYIPYLLQKWTPGARHLFFGNQKPYPGADNSMLFKREVIEKVQFRPLHLRQWPSLGGRGVGRDFVCQVAEIFQNSYTFDLPLYLWRQWTWNPRFIGYEKYLKKS